MAKKITWEGRPYRLYSGSRPALKMKKGFGLNPEQYKD